MSISPHIGTYSSGGSIQTERVERDPGLLVNRNDILCSFYSDLRPRLTGMAGEHWQHGNSPYCFRFGMPSWKEKFREDWFYRVFICFKKNTPDGPHFEFGVMLWNRSWTKNTEWFFARRASLVNYFIGLGFDVRRNEGSGWHRGMRWLPPYDITGLKHAGASWKPRIVLQHGVTWEALLSRSAERCLELATIVDDLEVN